MHVLLLEDNDEIGRWISQSLEAAAHVVDLFTTGPEALFAVTTREYEVMILNRMVPDLDGLSLLKALRAANDNTPALMLTAMSEIEDRVAGLEAGADDYLVKPFAASELLARVMALGRRNTKAQEKQTTKLVCRDLELDLLRRSCKRGGQKIELHAKELKMLETFMCNTGGVLTRTMLLERVWNINFDPETNVVDTNVSRLRSKIDKPFDTPLIRTIRGEGYVFGD